MSTKTSIKRIALVAVSALGFGMVTSVGAWAEADANEVTGIAVSAVVGNSNATGEAQSFTVKLDPVNTDDDEIYTLKVRVSAQPAGVNSISLTAAAGGADIGGANASTAYTSGTTAVMVVTEGAGDGSQVAALASTAVGNVSFTPSVVGSYTITAWHDQDGDGTINGAEVSGAATAAFTVAGAKTQAAISTATTSDRVSTVAVASTQNSARVGVLTSVTPNFKLTADSGAGGLTAGDFGVTLSYLLTKPSGSAAALSSASQTKTTTTAVAQPAADTEQAKEDMSAITFTPDVAGTYTVTAWHDYDADSQIDNGEASGSLAIVVAADAPVMTIKAFNTTAATGDYDTNVRGSLVRLTLTNGGVASSLSPSEKITVSVDGGQIECVSTSSACQSDELSVTTRDLTRDDFDSKGRVWLTLSASADGVQVITFDGVGGGVDSLLSTQSITYKTAAGVVDAWTLANETGVNEATPTALGGANGAYDINYLKATAVGVKISFGAADAIGAVHLKDVSGLITGLANAEYSTYLTGTTTAAGTATFTAPSFGGEATSVAGTSNYELSIGATLATDVAVVTARAAVDTAAKTVLDQNAAVRVTPATALTLSAVVKDQFGIAMPNVAVAISVTGRNAQIATANTVSDANGRVSITYTDAPLSGVVATTDTVTFNQPNGTDKTVTVTWVALGIDKVTVYTGGNTTAGVANATIVPVDIYAGDGAENGAVDFSVKVVDANGSIVVGVPVVFTIDKTGAAFTTKTATSYTSSTGYATGKIYGWLAGTYTVTATAGGKTGTGTITFANTAAGDERAISATVSGNVVTAKVVDRFGNPVKGVSVYATKTGEGTFGSGVSKVTDTTDANGLVDFSLTNGNTTVTVSLLNYNAAAGSNSSGQSCALKGNIDCAVGATAATAITAYTAGTATVAEVGVGASYDAAGVSSATVEVATAQTTDSVDAANEATDAANAATDAANAAAEAADAATAAAQDAQAAVAELATQVAALIAGIKAQITTLTNLVIKIQKKVKA